MACGISSRHIDTGTLATGCYFVRVKTDAGLEATAKWVVVR
jgi:hypothetical protein